VEYRLLVLTDGALGCFALGLNLSLERISQIIHIVRIELHVDSSWWAYRSLTDSEHIRDKLDRCGFTLKFV
jgi:hypothetical protein